MHEELQVTAVGGHNFLDGLLSTVFARSEAGLLFISSRNLVKLLFESGYYSRAVFIKLRKEEEDIHCLKEGCSECRCLAVNPATLATVMDTELEESDPFADVEEDEDELEENELVLADC